jgi:hypothetical protein
LLVTPFNLVRCWAKDNLKMSLTNPTDPESTATQTFKHKTFFTNSISSDAAIQETGELNLNKPAGVAVVRAALVVQSQDDGKTPPNAIAVAALVKDHTVIALLKTSGRTPTEPNKACQLVAADFDKRAKAVEKASPNDEKAMTRADELRDQGSAAYRHCYFEKLAGSAFMTTATTQAQTWLDSLPH